MRLSELYKKAIESGIRYDPRDGDAAESDLKKITGDYNDLSEEEKKWFDKDLLWNPYPDSRPVCGDEDGKDPEFKKVMVCIETPNVFVTNLLKPDLVISHHPDGRASSGLHQVLDMQIGIWKRYGVKIAPVDDSAAETSVKRLYTVAVKDSREDNLGDITEDLPDSYRVLGIPWIVFHTAADNCAATYLQKRIDSSKIENLQGIVDFLMTIPEYQQGTRELIGPRIISGKPKSKPGKIVVDMTGGEEAPPEIFSSFAGSGIETLICMHASKDWYESAGKHHIQVVCAGHATSDSLGMNLLLDEILPDYVEVLPNAAYPRIGGFRRFSHKNEKPNLSEMVKY